MECPREVRLAAISAVNRARKSNFEPLSGINSHRDPIPGAPTEHVFSGNHYFFQSTQSIPPLGLFLSCYSTSFTHQPPCCPRICKLKSTRRSQRCGGQFHEYGRVGKNQSNRKRPILSKPIHLINLCALHQHHCSFLNTSTQRPFSGSFIIEIAFYPHRDERG